MILPLDSDLDPVVNRGFWEQVSRDVEMQKDEVAHCKDEPWYWLVNYVYTKRKDENVEGGVLTRFPPDEYLRYFFHKLFTEDFFAADKPRQIRASITVMAWAVFHCQYKQHEQIVCQSKKKEDADTELIRERAYTIWKYQPTWLKPYAEYTCCHFKVPSTDSEIVGIPAGDNAGDQIRSKNPTKTILDEGGFYEGKFNECLAAALACCKNIKVISSANGGQWDEFINEKEPQ